MFFMFSADAGPIGVGGLPWAGKHPCRNRIIEESGGEKSTSGGIEESSEVEPGEIKETDGTEGDDGDKSHVEPGEAGDGDGPGRRRARGGTQR